MLEAYGQMRKRKILEFALSNEYQKKLNSEGWCLSENLYNQSIGKITEIEPEILLKLKQSERDRDSAKAILELQENAGLRIKSENGKRRSKCGNRDNDKSTPKANGMKEANGYYYLCGNCEKTHKGVCRKPVKGSTSDQNSTPRKD